MRSLPLPDCSSADHDYVFGGAWSYIRPDCRTLGVSDVVTKGKDSVSFTTSIIETVEHARQHWVQSGPWQRSSTRRPWARLVALCAACTPEECSRATVRAARTASASTAAPKPPRAAAP